MRPYVVSHLNANVALPLTVGMETGCIAAFQWLRAIFLALNREKVALNRWTECRAVFSSLMDLLSTPLRTDCMRACERGRVRRHNSNG